MANIDSQRDLNRSQHASPSETTFAADRTGYVELGRTFIELDDSTNPEKAARTSNVSLLGDDVGGLRWTDLLERRIVVILGEPGSGKTYELRHRCSVLANAGEDTFLIELERLVQEPLDAVLSPDDKSGFERWKRSSRRGYFFLDSLDEAKLRRQSDFHRALDRLRDGIGRRKLDECRFVISSRISEWRPETDRQEVRVRLGIGWSPTDANGTSRENGPDNSGLLVVQIQRLNASQVRLLASARGLSDVDAFVAALESSLAWDFAGRPLDVIGLFEFWKTHRRLGSLTEIIDVDVRHKLQERTSRLNSYSLPEVKAFEGAEALAAATLLCRQQQIAVPDESFGKENALNSRECLPSDWKAEEVNALLTRAVFDSATYGRIQFHHRSVGEYLTAKWFEERMKRGCPVRALEQVFFEIIDGKHVLRPSLAPAAAWMCTGSERWNAEFRAWVLESTPHIHLEHGDPEGLPLDYRRDLLRAWVRNNQGRERVWVTSSPDALRRLATPELAPDVSDLIVDKTIALDIREELALLVRFGRLKGCIPALLEIVGNASEPESLKRYAVASLRDIAPKEARQKLWEIVQKWASISAGTCSTVLEALFPEIINSTEMVTLLGRVSGEEGDVRSLTWSLERHLDDNLTPSAAGPLLKAVNDLARLPNYHWLREILPNVALRLLEGTSLSLEDSAAAADGLVLLAGDHDRFTRDAEEDHKLELASRQHTAVRRILFWRLVDESQIKDNVPVRIWFHSHRTVSFDRDDLEWLIADVRSRDDIAERQVALRMALHVCRWRKMTNSQRTELQNAIAGAPTLTQMLRQHRADWRWSPVRSWWFRMRNEPWRYRLMGYRHKIERRLANLRERWLLWRHRGKLRDGGAVPWLITLCSQARDQTHRWAPDCWARMAGLRGEGVAAAAKMGCQRV